MINSYDVSIIKSTKAFYETEIIIVCIIMVSGFADISYKFLSVKPNLKIV
jgi:hypothetical protein